MAYVWAIEKHDCLPSTMDEVHKRAALGAPEGLVVVAGEQTKGRGRRGNEWVAPPGNLYFSLLLRPVTDLRFIGQYAFLAAVALARTTSSSLRSEFSYTHKWPNDGLLNGRKFAGILLEGGEGHLALGVGVNIVSAPADKMAFNDAAARPYGAAEFLDVYLSHLSAILDQYAPEGFAPLRAEWLENAVGLNERITVRLPTARLEGIFNGLDEDGALLLGVADGTEKVIHSGEVYLRNEL